MIIVGPELDRAAECEVILRSLPGWFGIEHALQMYAADSAKLPTFALEDGGTLVGFLSLHPHFAMAWEIHCVAIAGHVRNQGLGSRLLRHAEDWLKAQGAEYLQVKTVAATSPDKNYAETRKFYEARGFTPLEIFPTLWDPWNPALQCIKRLDAR